MSIFSVVVLSMKSRGTLFCRLLLLKKAQQGALACVKSCRQACNELLQPEYACDGLRDRRETKLCLYFILPDSSTSTHRYLYILFKCPFFRIVECIIKINELKTRKLTALKLLCFAHTCSRQAAMNVISVEFSPPFMRQKLIIISTGFTFFFRKVYQA